MKKTLLTSALGSVLKIEPEEITARLITHHILILDRSGSMYKNMESMVEQAKRVLKTLPLDDIATVCWFSGSGDYGITLKGAQINDTNIRLLDSLIETVGATCFSEILNELVDTVKTFKPIVNRTVVNIFTDGQPVVSWTTKEETNRSITAIKALVANGVDVFNALGYRDYNESLLKAMVATATLGRCLHMTQITDYSEILTNSLGLLGLMSCEPLDIKTDGQVLFVNGELTTLTTGDFAVNYSAKQPVYVLVKSPIIEVNGEKVDISKLKLSSESLDPSFYYALASAHYYLGNPDVLDALLAVKDRFLLDKLNGAFSNSERAEFQKLLNSAISDLSVRMQNGETDSSYQINHNAPTFFDLLEVLSAQQATLELPTYNSISRGSVVVKNYFTPHDKAIKVKLYGDNIVFNKTRLNVSVSTTVKGFVELSETDSKAFMSNKFDCKVFRNYNLIKDGEYNVPEIWVSIDDPTTLNQFGDAVTLIPDGRYSIQLNQIPKTTRKELETNTAEFYFDLNKEMLFAEAQQKVLKYLIKANDKPVSKLDSLTELQVQILEKYGVNGDGIYNPPSVAMDKSNCDQYVTREIEFKLKGATLPKVDDVVSGKAKSAIAKVMLECYNKFSGLGLDYVETELSVVKATLQALRLRLARAKFAMLLTNSFIKGLDKDNDSFTYLKEGWTMNVVVKYGTAYYS